MDHHPMAHGGTYEDMVVQPEGEAWRSFMEDDDLDDLLPTIIRIDSNDIIYEQQQPHASLIADKYLKGEVLGDGSYSKVKEALDIQTLCRRAIKIVKIRNIRKIPNGHNNVKREIQILKRLKHTNVISLIEEFFSHEKQKLYIVLEYCCCNLQTMLDSAPRKVLAEWQAHYYFIQLIAGLEYLHSRGVIHKDIKPGNLLLTIDQILKITDLGVSEQLDSFAKDDTITTSQGSPVCLAPEIAAGAETFSGFKIDIWSCGITLYRMCEERFPFDASISLYQLYDNIATGVFEIPSHFSDTLKDLIRGILCKEPDDRFTIPQIQSTRWFREQRPAVISEAVPMPAPPANPAFTMSVLPALAVLVGADQMAADYAAENEEEMVISATDVGNLTNNATQPITDGEATYGSCIAENGAKVHQDTPLQPPSKKHKNKCSIC